MRARARAHTRTKHLDFRVVSSLYADNSPPQPLSSAAFSKEVDRQSAQVTRHYGSNGDVCTQRDTAVGRRRPSVIACAPPPSGLRLCPGVYGFEVPRRSRLGPDQPDIKMPTAHLLQLFFGLFESSLSQTRLQTAISSRFCSDRHRAVYICAFQVADIVLCPVVLQSAQRAEMQ